MSGRFIEVKPPILGALGEARVFSPVAAISTFCAWRISANVLAQRAESRRNASIMS